MREADWERKAARADVIHHRGAEVNFLYPYEKLRAANVFGTQEVLRLAARLQPELLDSAVEEILRYTSVIQRVSRTVLHPQI